MYIRSFNIGEVQKDSQLNSSYNVSTPGIRNSHAISFNENAVVVEQEPISRSQVTFNPKEVLKDAKKRRSLSISRALARDVNNQRNRVRYL